MKYEKKHKRAISAKANQNAPILENHGEKSRDIDQPGAGT
jgi:hypothetical protein